MKIIIIGASSGLGYGIAQTYIKQGHKVCITARRKELLKKMAEGHPDVSYAVMDVRNTEQSVRVLQEIIVQMEGIDLLVLSAGIGKMNPSLDFHTEEEALETNVRGWTAIVDFSFNYFIRRRQGHLVAITSFAAIRGLAPAPSYSASKAYQCHYLEALRQRTIAKRIPVHISDIRPGFVRTPLLSHPEDLFWVIEPDKAVRQIVQAIEKRKAVYTITRRWRLFAPLVRIVSNRIIAKIICK